MEWITSEMERRGGLARAIGSAALGRGHLELGELEAARTHLERALELGYDEPEVKLALGLGVEPSLPQRARAHRRARVC